MESAGDKAQNRKVRTNSKTKLVQNLIEGTVAQTELLPKLDHIQPPNEVLVAGTL